MRAASQPAWQRSLMRHWQGRGWLAWLLRPLSLLLTLLVRLRQALYRNDLLKSARLPVPVIVVGNVVAGGAGKTPVVMALVRHLQARGLHPGVISRGYGRHSQGCLEVQADSHANETGDEPTLIQRRTGAPVFVAARRAEAARALLARYPKTNVLICDDGLQHYALARDIDICVFDDRGVGNGWLLPAGPLREPWPRAVDLVLHTSSPPAFSGYTSQRALASHATRADGSQIELATLARTTDRPLLALAAIARPEAFFAMLQAQGLPLSRTLPLPDHYDFSQWQRPDEQDYVLLCTEKDAVKLWEQHPDAWAVPLEFSPEPAFLQVVDRLLAEAFDAKLSSTYGHTTS